MQKDVCFRVCVCMYLVGATCSLNRLSDFIVEGEVSLWSVVGYIFTRLLQKEAYLFNTVVFLIGVFKRKHYAKFGAKNVLFNGKNYFVKTYQFYY